MEGDNSAHPRHLAAPQSIPLQTLSRPPENDDHPHDTHRHRRTFSERSRDLLRAGAPGRPGFLDTDYARLRDGSPTRNSSRGPFDRATLDPYNPPTENNASELHSPLDGAGFQAAMGFEGLSFDPNTAYSSRPARPLSPDLNNLNNLLGHNDSLSSLPLHGYDDYNMDASLPAEDIDEDDRAPLTEAGQRRTIRAVSHSPSPKQKLGRSKSVRFSVGGPSSSRRLGDDLPHAEAGLRTPERRRGASVHILGGLSPSSAESRLQRAGTIVRNMSQRIVNLSNEPELIEQSMRRRSSVRQSREAATTDPVADDSPYSTDGTQSPREKPVFQQTVTLKSPDWTKTANPLRGNSIGVFPPESRLRTKLCDLLVHPATEPFILILILAQVVLLAVDAAPSVFENPLSQSWGHTWIDYALLGLFVIYTIEIAIRVIVSGLIINPIEYSTINRRIGWRKALRAKFGGLFALTPDTPTTGTDASFGSDRPSILRTFTGNPMQTNNPVSGRQQIRTRLAQRAFLRHSFNRLDFVAVVSYWIYFVTALLGTESNKHLAVFRMLSCLRILRLLGLTSGTSIILRSLKKAAPLLLNVALLIGFFWLLFAIVGVQSFKGSLRRFCVWVDPQGTQQNYTNNAIGSFQFCGGSLAVNGTILPYYYTDGTSSGVSKGYLCPPHSYCVSDENPYNGTVSFDNLPQSLELVFVIMSSNTFTDLLYYLTDTDYLIAALFFAVSLVVMALWLMNLLIAVITSSFQVIREESKTSAFAAEESGPSIHLDTDEKLRVSKLKRIYDKTYWLWVAVIAFGSICQTLRSATMGPTRADFINVSETGVTVILLIEIVLRFSSDWRAFFKHRNNLFDLALAIITTIMQIPLIHNSGQVYAWLSIFQILRIYRIVLAIPWTRDLISLVLGNVYGLLNLMVFVFLITFLAAIFASQLFRGELPQQDDYGNTIRTTFFTIYNSFLGMYQILSSENWTNVVYYVTNYDRVYNTAWIGAIFFIMWFIVGFFIVLNMFIAVIQENFDVSEDEKRLQQVKAFLQQKEHDTSAHGTLSLSKLFKLRQITNRRQDPLDYGPAMMEMLLKEAVVKDFLDDGIAPVQRKTTDMSLQNSRPLSATVPSQKVSSLWNKFLGLFHSSEPNPFYSRVHFSRAYEDLDPRTMAQEVVTAAEHRKRAQREYLHKYPKYNVSLFIFKPRNPVRQLCQKIVGPGRGAERIEGTPPTPIVWYIFSAIIYAAIVAMVILACITTPLYQKEYFQEHKFSVANWFVYIDLAFAGIFSVEAAIKVIADGFFWTPNAYFRSSWGFIDGIVLVSLWINVAASFYNEGAVSRAVGAFKALRALRLLHVSDSARGIFHSVIIRGGWKVLSAAFVSLSLLIPFAIYGLNLFNGRMYACNDRSSNIYNLTGCIDEYLSSPYNWNVLAPRQAANPYYDFDNFGSSLFILFQIVSLEGWIDVMWSAQSITGFFQQPEPFAAQGNAVFFIIFNLLGTVFVLTLFVSVFMRNYTERTGVAFLTTDQRSWLELRKLLRQISPSKRPSLHKKRETWVEWCYKRSVRKTGRWSRFVTIVLVLHLILLCLEWDGAPSWWERTRDYIFLFLTLFFAANIIIRIVGLTWTRFRKSSWDLYSVFAVGGTLVTSIILQTDLNQRIYNQVNKLFLVSITLLLIPRNNQLDQLFKTAAASLKNIGSLVATWFVLYLVFAIAMTQTFGLTRFGSQENGNLNFRSVPKALILLFRMSAGEGWNQIMEDFAQVVAPFCVTGSNYFDGDCGSVEWARVLFISWNILSMYIFVNMFVSLIFESFSYVYQRSSGLSVISREETRRFKQAWAEFDPKGTGYISKESFPRFLGELSGLFDMRIYNGDFTLGRLKEECRVVKRRSELPIDEPDNYEIDLDKLNQKLATLPVQEIRQRRMRLNIFYEEVLVSADPDRGIAFTTLLMILAHYKVINDNKSLRLEEFLRRRARLQRVEEAVRRSIVISFFDTAYRSRQFRRMMEVKKAGRMTAIPEISVPEIFVEEALSPTGEGPSRMTVPSLTLQIPERDASPTGSARSLTSEGGNESMWQRGRHGRSNSIQLSPGSAQFPAGSRSRLSPHRSSNSDGGREPRHSGSGSLDVPASPTGSHEGSQDGGRHSRSNSTVSARDMMELLDNSAWGESLRRSFTQRRSQEH